MADASRPIHPLVLLVLRLRAVIATIVTVLAVATTGFVIVAGYSWFNALYMAVITLGTIGYSEVEPLSSAGRAWAIVVITLGFATFLYAAAIMSSFIVSGEFSDAARLRKETRVRSKLQNHAIVVGYGRVGRAVVSGLRADNLECVVIDTDRDRAAPIEAGGAVALIADATEEATLHDAGIERAIAVVTAAHDDATNLVVVLTARALAPKVRIVARVNDPSWTDRISRAGADVVMSPYESYGASLAASATQRSVIALQDLPNLGLRTEEFTVLRGSPFVGQSMHDVACQHPDVLVIGLRRESGIAGWHQFEGSVEVNDVIVTLGEPTAMKRFAERVGYVSE